MSSTAHGYRWAPRLEALAAALVFAVGGWTTAGAISLLPTAADGIRSVDLDTLEGNAFESNTVAGLNSAAGGVKFYNRILAEFDLTVLQGLKLDYAVLRFNEGAGDGGDTYAVESFYGNGVLELSDFQAPTVTSLGTFVQSTNGVPHAFDVTPDLIGLLAQGRDSYGIRIRMDPETVVAGSHYAFVNSLEIEYSGRPLVPEPGPLLALVAAAAVALVRRRTRA